MFTENQIQLLNKAFKDESPAIIIEQAFALSNNAIITTNFRPYESAILYAVTNTHKNTPVIWCDTGYNTPQTYRFAENLMKALNLNLFLYVPQQTAAHRDVLMGIPAVDTPEHDIFTHQVKLEPFKRAMAEHQPKVWFTNLRKGQTAFRDSIDIFSLSKDGILKVSPFYYWDDIKLDEYLAQHQLPNEFKYFDPTKAFSNRECGLHP